MSRKRVDWGKRERERDEKLAWEGEAASAPERERERESPTDRLPPPSFDLRSVVRSIGVGV